MNRRHLLAATGASAALGIAGCSTAAPSTAAPTGAPAGRVRLGIDQLAAAGFAALGTRRIGLVTNQTGVDGTGALTRVVLKAGIGDRLVSLFGPEHGLDTRTRAGDHVADGRDPVTGLKTWSLYGARRKPTADMLADIDALMFDIQDIGIRSYTYISTMALAMEACGEAGKDFIVLDRPNPMGGAMVDGPPLLPDWVSFVGQVPVPYLHGLTVGELARMIVARRWIRAVPRLEVIEMAGWRRTANWGATGLGWVATSPNIPRWTSPYFCAATGILGELRGVDIGIGTDFPFEVAAGPGIDPDLMARELTAQNWAGVTFSPYRSASRQGFAGVRIAIDPDRITNLMGLGVALCAEVVVRANGQPLRDSPAGALDLFQKAYGGPALLEAIRGGTAWRGLAAGWRSSLAAFERERPPHLLYG